MITQDPLITQYPVLNLITISFILFIVILGVVSSAYYLKSYKTTTSILNEIAIRNGGIFNDKRSENKGGKKREIYTLQFNYLSTIIHIFIINTIVNIGYTSGEGFETFFKININLDKDIQFYIRRKYRIYKDSGLPKIILENKIFSKKYHIEGNNESIVKMILTDVIQEKILNIKRMQFIIKCYNNSLELYISSQSLIKKEKEYEQYIELVKSLYNRMAELRIISH